MQFAWLFLLWPMVEIGLFVTLGGWIGVWGTWTVVLGTGVLGVLLIRWQKRTVIRQVVRDLQTLGGGGLTPAAHSAMIVLAGALLILPGFLTDALGLLLLIPFVRSFVIGKFRARARGAAQAMGVRTGFQADLGPRDYEVIDAEAEELPPSPPRLHKPSGWTKP